MGEYFRSVKSSKLYFAGLKNGQEYLNNLYRDLNLNLRDLNADEIVEAYSTAIEAKSKVNDS